MPRKIKYRQLIILSNPTLPITNNLNENRFVPEIGNYYTK